MIISHQGKTKQTQGNDNQSTYCNEMEENNMAEIKVTSGSLTRQADELNNLLTRFKSEVTKMDGYENQMAGMYEAESQKAFRQAFNNDKTKMEQFQRIVEKYIQALRDDAKRYEAAEQKVRSIAQQRSY